MTPFPWAEAMQFGFGVLRLPPDAFWRMTPRELAHAVQGARGPVPPVMARGRLRDLMQLYPDRPEDLHE